MEPISPELVAVFIASTGVGYLMMVSGVGKSMLEWRRQRRNCPSCGRIIEHRVCSACGG